VRLQVFEHEMLAEDAKVVSPERVPSARKTHHPGVTPVDLGLLGRFVPAAAVERADNGRCVGVLQHTQVDLDRGPRDARIPRGRRHLELAAALTQETHSFLR
jgi:hypothetical protein